MSRSAARSADLLRTHARAVERVTGDLSRHGVTVTSEVLVEGEEAARTRLEITLRSAPATTHLALVTTALTSLVEGYGSVVDVASAGVSETVGTDGLGWRVATTKPLPLTWTDASNEAWTRLLAAVDAARAAGHLRVDVRGESALVAPPGVEVPYAVARPVRLVESRPEHVALATTVLDDVLAGAPLEWALRRAEGAS